MHEVVPISAVAALSDDYPALETDLVAAVVNQAEGTVTRLFGRPDIAMALDLARLRLDVRARRYA